jgi:hypothetical protein
MGPDELQESRNVSFFILKPEEDAGTHKIYVKMIQKIRGNFFLSFGLLGTSM